MQNPHGFCNAIDAQFVARILHILLQLLKWRLVGYAQLLRWKISYTFFGVMRVFLIAEFVQVWSSPFDLQWNLVRFVAERDAWQTVQMWTRTKIKTSVRRWAGGMEKREFSRTESLHCVLQEEIIIEQLPNFMRTADDCGLKNSVSTWYCCIHIKGRQSFAIIKEMCKGKCQKKPLEYANWTYVDVHIPSTQRSCDKYICRTKTAKLLYHCDDWRQARDE